MSWISVWVLGLYRIIIPISWNILGHWSAIDLEYPGQASWNPPPKSPSEDLGDMLQIMGKVSCLHIIFCIFLNRPGDPANMEHPNILRRWVSW